MDSSTNETQTKTPVGAVQELIAIHTTRIEASEKLQDLETAGELTPALKDAAQQSHQFVSELMSELSNYGDGVQADVDRHNEYQVAWKDTLGKLDNMKDQDIASAFQVMEAALKKFYQTLVDSKIEMPVSLQEILNRQLKEL